MDISVFLSSMLEGAEAIKSFAAALAVYVLGWWYVYTAGLRTMKLSAPHSNQSYGWPSVFARAAGGILFIKSADFINMWVLTVTGAAPNSTNAMSVVGGGGSPWMMIGSVVLAWLGMFGVIAILRGIQLLVKSGDGSGGGSGMDRDPLATGFIFLVAGAIGVNMSRFIDWII